MGYLDNSGDIILDAVLTDAGRARLAKGDGSFNIAKFALGDDEIDYNLYNPSPALGTGYEDLRILQLPVLEAFTNNSSVLKNKLVSYSNQDLLYLPVIKLNNLPAAGAISSAGAGKTANAPTDGYYLTVNSATQNIFEANEAALLNGGDTAAFSTHMLMFDQGVDTRNEAISFLTNVNLATLVEQEYIVEVDSRLMKVVTPGGGDASESFIDDDYIASYVFTVTGDGEYFATSRGQSRIEGDSPFGAWGILQQVPPAIEGASTIGNTNNGYLGTRFIFGIMPTTTVVGSNKYFTQLGGTETIPTTATTVKTINTMVRITGIITGYRVDIPIRIIKA
tara:strand:- start:2395 stop:3402 length:1008 start_codon:yes stop_codon:yes gene_type:complete